MSCDEALELISAALDGELSPSERNALDEHLANCPACAALYEELAGHSRLLRDLDCEAPADLTDRILSQLPERQPAPVKKGRAVHWRRWGALAACLALALWVGLFFPNWGAGTQTSEPIANRSASDENAETASLQIASNQDPGIASYSAGPVIGKVQYLRIDRTEDAAPAAQLLTSYTEQTELLSRYRLEAPASVPEADYYDTGALIAVTLEETSDSISHTVEAIVPADGGYEIIIQRQVPEAVTNDTAAWLILIEVDRSITPDVTLTVTLTG